MNVQTYIALSTLALALFLQTGAIAFVMGRLFQRVTSLEKANDADAANSRSVARLEVQMEHIEQKVDRLCNDMQGVHRQLANIATGRAGATVYELGQGT